MYRYQTPYVITQLVYDYFNYGYCGYTITDTPNEFAIERIKPYYV